VDKCTAITDDYRQYSRSDNLLIHGVPSDVGGLPEKQLDKKVLEIINSHIPDINLAIADISTLHRMGLLFH
jgi:hypothetical protein